MDSQQKIPPSSECSNSLPDDPNLKPERLSFSSPIQQPSQIRRRPPLQIVTHVKEHQANTIAAEDATEPNSSIPYSSPTECIFSHSATSSSSEFGADEGGGSSDLEGSAEGNGNTRTDDKTFSQRLTSKPKLTTRQSLIATMLYKPQSTLKNSLQCLLGQKKQTSFQEEVAIRTLDNEQYSDNVFKTDEEDCDKGAVNDDDDSSNWEDVDESADNSKDDSSDLKGSTEGSENASIDDKTFFQRVNSKPNITTRQSLITTMLHQNDRTAALATAASRSTPALQRSCTASSNSPSLAASPDSDEGSLLMMKKTGLKPIAEIPRSGPAPQPIIQTTSTGYHLQLALSPRTTRRNMLATELTVSLRQHLLWERQQKSQTANAVLKRRHTAHGIANLKQYPDKVHMGHEDRDEMRASWNQYFSAGLGEYHSKGW